MYSYETDLISIAGRRFIHAYQAVYGLDILLRLWYIKCVILHITKAVYLMKRLMTMLLAVAMLLSCAALPTSALYENDYVLTGDGAADLIGVAKTQVGYNEGSLEGDIMDSNNYQKYGVWYDETVENIGAGHAAWEATFILWCADQAGIGFDMIPAYVYLPYMKTWYENAGLYHDVSAGEEYAPKAGDLIFFKSSSSTTVSHIGIVTNADEQYVYTIEGNAQPPIGECVERGSVVAKQYSKQYSRIGGYATPSYTQNTGDVDLSGTVDTTDARKMLKSVLGSSDERVYLIDLDKDGKIGTSDTRELLCRVLAE